MTRNLMKAVLDTARMPDGPAVDEGTQARMRRITRLLWPLPLLCTASAPPQPNVLTIEVLNVRSARGAVHVDICPEAKFLDDDCPWSGDAPARLGATRVTVANLPSGTYAAQVFFDENGNGKVDRALFGIPKEGVGFSNDAPIRWSPPKFKDARFAYDGGAGATIRLNLRYFLGPKGPPAKS